MSVDQPTTSTQPTIHNPTIPAKHSSNWHQRHRDEQGFGERLADVVASRMGSWSFIIIQSLFVGVWIIANIIGLVQHWDPYPFILLNLLFSTQAAYAAPIIMMSQNRQAERDRVQAEADYETNRIAKDEIEELQRHLARIENDKLDLIIKYLKLDQKK